MLEIATLKASATPSNHLIREATAHTRQHAACHTSYQLRHDRIYPKWTYKKTYGLWDICRIHCLRMKGA